MKIKFDADRVVAFSAMFISLLTLIIFMYQTNLMQEQSRLSVIPRLSFNEVVARNDLNATLRCELTNKGLGPAIIDSIAIIHNGKRVVADFADFFKNKLPQVTALAKLESSTFLEKGNTLGEKESVLLFSLNIDPTKFDEAIRLINSEEMLQLFDIEVVYSSIYEEEHWKIQLGAKDSSPRKL